MAVNRLSPRAQPEDKGGLSCLYGMNVLGGIYIRIIYSHNLMWLEVSLKLR